VASSGSGGGNGNGSGSVDLKDRVAQLMRYSALHEAHSAHMLRTKDLETKLAEAKLRAQSEFAGQETRKAKALRDRLEEATRNEVALKSQLNGYAEKFEQVQATLSKSNDLFGTCTADRKTIDRIKRQKSKLETLCRLFGPFGRARTATHSVCRVPRSAFDWAAALCLSPLP
jgi:hypothetical protein